jgi:hypothetical protein
MKIHGQAGALTDLLKIIDDSRMHGLDDVFQFRNNYAVVRQKK